MPVCEVCGNDYDKAFEVRARVGHTSSIASSAPSTHWRLPVPIAAAGSSGMASANGRIFCCAHCAGQEGVPELRDRV